MIINKSDSDYFEFKIHKKAFLLRKNIHLVSDERSDLSLKHKNKNSLKENKFSKDYPKIDFPETSNLNLIGKFSD
jgi:hypothetical protein